MYQDTGLPVIQGVSFSFENYDKVALIGKVGSGKSTLLNAILREAYVVKGGIYMGTKSKTGVVMAEQNPLIITGTVRSNILYGSAYDKEYYDAVVQACQLSQAF